jgi:hypothetical protein
VAKVAREKLIYRETYKKGATFDKRFLPITKHHETFQPRRMDALACGLVEDKDGTQWEFHDVRLYFPHESQANPEAKP